MATEAEATPAFVSALSQTDTPIPLPSFDVAGVPDAADYTGCLIYVTDGAEGSATFAWSNGTNWIEEDGTAIDDGA